jgi:hypothetical protein
LLHGGREGGYLDRSFECAGRHVYLGRLLPWLGRAQALQQLR